jgi:hypothetical protein
VFVLSNHGLVVCEDSSESAEELLYEIDQRLAIPARCAPEPDYERLLSLTDEHWHMPSNPALHSFSTDEVSRAVMCKGTLYPCQAMFFGPSIQDQTTFRMVDDAGILVRSDLTDTEYAMLAGLQGVLQRIPAGAPVSYLPRAEVARILTADAPRYRGYVDCR